MTFQSHEEKLLSECFNRFGINEDAVNISKMINGGSGAIVAELLLHGRKMILKFTAYEAELELYRNAQKERRFYMHGALQVNIQSPTVVAEFEDSAFGIGLLMQAYQQTPHPSEWGNELITKALTQISRMHSMFCGKEKEIQRIIGEESYHHRFEYRKEEITKSIEAWEHVYSAKNLDEYSPIPKSKILQLLRNLDQLESNLSMLPHTLIHGDFHMENCLLDDNQEIVVVDWQSPKIGSGAEDVGNFLARAELYGNPLSTNAYIALYQQLLENQVQASFPLNKIEQTCHSKRLLLHLFWSPRYVLYYPDRVLSRVLEAIKESYNTLGIET